LEFYANFIPPSPHLSQIFKNDFSKTIHPFSCAKVNTDYGLNSSAILFAAIFLG